MNKTKQLENRVVHLRKQLRLARQQAQQFKRLDSEAAQYVESVIVMRCHNFTGEPPYVGWKGLGLALTEYMNKADCNLKKLERFKSQTKSSKKKQ